MVFPDRILATEMEGTSKAIAILSYAQVHASSPLIRDGVMDSSALSDTFDRVFGQLGKKADSAVVALSSDIVFSGAIPVDESLSHHALQSHILWELGHFVESPEEYVTNTTVLNHFPEKHAKLVLLVAFQKRWIDMLRLLLLDRHISLSAIDTTHFGAEYFFRSEFIRKFSQSELSALLHPERAAGTLLALVGVGAQRIDISILRDGRSFAYIRQVLPESRAEDEIAHEVVRVLLNNFQSIRPGWTVILHGERATQEQAQAFRSISKTDVTLLDPFRYLKASEALRQRIENGPLVAGGIGLGLRAMELLP